MVYSGVDVFGSSFNITAHFSNLNIWLGGQVIDAGVEECKGFSPPNEHTTSASSTPLPLGAWNLNKVLFKERSSPENNAPMRLCLGFIAANAAAEGAARMAATARRARQLLGKKIFR